MKRNIIFTLIGFFYLMAGCHLDKNQEQATDQPNILWITCEDITPMLGTYGDPEALTPNLDRLADQGIQFNHAYSTAAVCSPARSCLVTGIYATSMGTQNLRSDFDIPKNIRTVPHILREHGYYCSNNYKEDYNFEDSTIWDESSHEAHWRKRPPGKPFFSVFNIETTHQSQIFGDDESFEQKYGKLLSDTERHSPDSIRLPSYYLDSPEVRKLWARYYDLVTIMDHQVQAILDELAEDELAGNTIVFYFSDHGTGMPRAKRALYNSGVQVPFIVYVPEKYRTLSPYQPGSKVDEIVSFIDFPPTVLSLAGIDAPDYMQGEPFMGHFKTLPRKYAFASSDRVDEAYELSRTVKTEKYSYIRNFLPHLPLIQPNFYTDQSEIMQELYRLKATANMTPAQQSMWLPKRFPEELYDLETDPDETVNLALDPAYQNKLLELRQVLKDWILRIRDTGFMPEGYMKKIADGKTVYEMRMLEDLFPLDRILELNDRILNDPIDQQSMVSSLNDPQELIRYWAAISIHYLDDPDIETIEALEDRLSDPSGYVRLAVCDALCSFNHCTPEVQETILTGLHAEDEAELLMAARIFELHRMQATGIEQEVKAIRDQLREKTKGKWKGYDLYATWALNEAFKEK
jgi:N-sulfoglucosamine sulfohydrolase